MKQHIESLIQKAIVTLQESGELPVIPDIVQVDATKDKQHGDFASNAAIIMAKAAKRKPRDIADLIIKKLPVSSKVQKVEIAGPGFINFFLTPDAFNDVIVDICKLKEQFGRCKIGREKTVLIEFVSSNPTGPLHVGHGRHAAYGAVVGNLLDAVGFKVSREYYINDAGRQMDILAVSVWLRYLALCGETIVFPANGYRGDYVIDIAKSILAKHGELFRVPAAKLTTGLPLDEQEGGDKELYIDAVIERAKLLLGDNYEPIFALALANILADIREDLTELNVHFDKWFSERELVNTNVVDRLLETLKAGGYTYERDGAIWFASTRFSDNKDRVLVRSNGQRTYFTNDVAYHLNKYERHFDIVMDILGADHHGYTPRMKSAVEAMGINPERLITLLVQFVTLYRDGKQAQMSTRGGDFVTLRELRKEVGNDVARFFYVMRKADQHMDFDLDLAKSESNENPVYYIQYAYARICSVFKQLADRNIAFNEMNGMANINLLTEPQERQILNTLSRYPDMIINAALQYETHQLTHYLRDLAADFHAYYNAHQFLVDDAAMRDARLTLVTTTKQILLNGFGLLGINAPESM